MTSEAQPDVSGAADDEGRREIEWQLSAPDLGLVRKWLSDHGSVHGLTIESRPTHTINDTYLDTEDWRLRRAGFALRLRDVPGRAEATLKDITPASDGVRIRREFNEPLPSAEFEALAVGSGPVSSRVHAVAGAEPLKALFRVRTQRECFVALEHEDQQAAEIALDDTTVATPDGGSMEHLTRVEVEAISGTPESLEGLVGQLRSECALMPATDSKYEMGLRVAGLEQPAAPELGSLRIDPSLSAGEVGRANLRRHLASWLAHEPAARLGEDPEALHELRVAGRRIETTLGVFEPYLPKSLVRQRPGWKSLVRALGTVRDLDVQLAGLAAFVDKLHDSDAGQVAPLLERLTSERRSARSRMLSMLDRPSTRAPGAPFARCAGQACSGARPRGQPGGCRGRAEADSREFQEGATGCACGAGGRQRSGASRTAASGKAVALHDRGVRRLLRPSSSEAAAGDTPPAEEPGVKPGCVRRRGPVSRDGPFAHQALAAGGFVLDGRFRRAEYQRRR